MIWTKEEEIFLVENVSKLSVLELATALNKTEATIRGKKSRLGIKSGKRNLISKDEEVCIVDWYSTHPNALDLDQLSDIMNRTETEICRVARRLNLTNVNRITITEDVIIARKEIKRQNHIRSINQFIELVRTNHPKGMLGKNHTDKTKQILSTKHKIVWKNKTDEERAVVYSNFSRGREKLKGMPRSKYSKTGGIREDLNKYFRSKWEANIARTFNYSNIVWEFEPKRFYFSDISDGIESYLPDFYLPELDIWIEVKGWMKDLDKLRINKFKEFYPVEYEKMVLIDEKLYIQIGKKLSHLIPKWEFKNNKAKVS